MARLVLTSTQGGTIRVRCGTPGHRRTRVHGRTGTRACVRVRGVRVGADRWRARRVRQLGSYVMKAELVLRDGDVPAR